MLLDRNRYSLLLDYYDVLLTQHQVDILKEYLNEDLSMNEIAENLMISKSAVQDLIKRTLNQLDTYEKKLKLLEKETRLDEILEQMEAEDSELLNKYVKIIRKTK